MDIQLSCVKLWLYRSRLPCEAAMQVHDDLPCSCYGLASPQLPFRYTHNYYQATLQKNCCCSQPPMSFNLASGPRSQFLAWAGVCGGELALAGVVHHPTNCSLADYTTISYMSVGPLAAGVAAYITIKRRTAEKKKIDMANKLAAQAAGDGEFHE
jgi:hypothetical protein